MNKYEFIADIVSSISWPSIVLIVILLLRKPLAKILISISKFRYKDLELDFEKLRSSVDLLPEKTKNEKIPVSERQIYSSFEDQISDIAPRSPEGAILIAWTAVEAAISSVVARLSISPESPSNRSVVHNINVLNKYTDLDEKAVSTINEMRHLRVIVAHKKNIGPQVSVSQALEYGVSAGKIINILQNLNREGRNDVKT